MIHSKKVKTISKQSNCHGWEFLMILIDCNFAEEQEFDK